jgi:hypothetical protein
MTAPNAIRKQTRDAMSTGANARSTSGDAFFSDMSPVRQRVA